MFDISAGKFWFSVEFSHPDGLFMILKKSGFILAKIASGGSFNLGQIP
jgi:hypothetical protein